MPPKPKAASPVVDEPTRVMVLEKPQPAPQPEMPESVQEEPEKTPAPTVQAAANGRCVLISGGDRGIGAAAARAFYAAGYRVAVLYHSNAKAAAELEKQLPGITAVQCDVASRASCELAFRTAEQALGRVDVLVSNAGIAQQKLFTDITPEEWQHMLDVNLTGAFHLCQLALPGMRARHSGMIINVSSIGAVRGALGNGYYSAAKGALELASEALAKETAHLGIRVMLVEPGAFRTAFYDSELKESEMRILDYDALAQYYRKQTVRHDQLGDPAKGGAIIVDTALRQDAPLRLILGSDALQAGQMTLQERLDELRTWQEISKKSDHEDHIQ